MVVVVVDILFFYFLSFHACTFYQVNETHTHIDMLRAYSIFSSILRLVLHMFKILRKKSKHMKEATHRFIFFFATKTTSNTHVGIKMKRERERAGRVCIHSP